MKVLVAQLCPTLCDPMDCSLPGSSVHGILQGRILEWIAISFSRGSSQSRDRTQVSCIAGRFFTIWATREACLCWGLREYFFEDFFFSYMDNFWNLYWICHNIVSVLCFVFFFFWPWHMWALSSLTTDWTCTLSIGRWSLNHWDIREVPGL